MARFITTSIDLPTIDNTTITMIRSGSKLYSICEFTGMHKAFYFWQVEVDGSIWVLDRGLDQSQIDITVCDGEQFRVRLTVTYNGENRYFEVTNDTAEAIEESEFAAASTDASGISPSTIVDTFNFKAEERDALILSAATIFSANQNQDQVHNKILTYLLESLDLGSIQEGHAPAYEAIRQGLTHPLYHIRKSSDLSQVEPSDFFIRDFLMLHTLGGESTKTPISLNGIEIHDGAIDSEFSEEFNLLVDEINDQNMDLGLRTDVKYFDQLAHRDGLQLIPRSATLNQFMGAIMSHVILEGNSIKSDGALQGIFASDGAFRNLQLINNQVRTAGAHSISIAGMLSGKISGNIMLSSATRTVLRPTLHPLRIGGGANIKILSFANQPGLSADSDNYYEYEEIEGNQVIDDLRRIKPATPRGTATYWHDVDMVKLQQLYPDAYARVKRLGPWPHEIPRTWKQMMREVGTEA